MTEATRLEQDKTIRTFMEETNGRLSMIEAALRALFQQAGDAQDVQVAMVSTLHEVSEVDGDPLVGNAMMRGAAKAMGKIMTSKGRPVDPTGTGRRSP